MKKIKILLLASIAFAMFSCSPASHDFVLRGSFIGQEGTTLFLSYRDTAGIHFVDSAIVEHGKFEFRGIIKEPTMASLTASREHPRNDAEIARFFMESTVMTMVIDQADFSQYQLTGSLSDDLFRNLNERRRGLQTRMGELRLKSRNLPTGPERGAVEEELRAISDEIRDINVEFVKNNPTSVIAAHTLFFALSSLDFETGTDLYNSLSPNVRNSRQGKEIAASLERTSRGEPGRQARLFVRTDINGEELNLFELNRDNYLLINFWASWCPPCRATSNPHLRRVHERYRNENLVIVFIGDNDNTQDQWRQAIEEDGIGEFRHVLRGLKRLPEGGFDRSYDLSENFGNRVLPTAFLIDRTGTIILRSTGDKEALDAKLKEIFGF